MLSRRIMGVGVREQLRRPYAMSRAMSRAKWKECSVPLGRSDGRAVVVVRIGPYNPGCLGKCLVESWNALIKLF
jgi:hypothetical protein